MEPEQELCQFPLFKFCPLELHGKRASSCWVLVIVIVQLLSRILLFLTPWTVARQAPLSMGFPWQEYWRGLPFPSPGDLPHPRIKPESPALQVDSLPLSH